MTTRMETHYEHYRKLRTTSVDTQMNLNDMRIFDDGTTQTVGKSALAEHLNIAGDAQREGDFQRADEILREVIALYSLIDLPIATLCPMTIRMAAVFDKECVNTIADLVQRTLSDVRRLKNFGLVSRVLIGNRLRTFNLNLAEQRDYAWIKKLPKPRSKRIDRLLLLPTFVLATPEEP